MSDGKAPVTRHDPITGQNLRIEFEEIAQPSHPDAEALHTYWQERRRAGGFVLLRDAPAKPIARLTKHLVVLEPLPEASDFRYRVVGTVLRERLGRDVTGMAVTEVFDAEPAQSLIEAARQVIETDAPLFRRLHVRGLFTELRRPELVLLPTLSSDSAQCWVLIGVFYHE